MKFLGRAFNFYINSSIHVALAVVAFAVVTMVQKQLGLNWDLLLFIFFATITGYNFVKYAEIAGLHHRSLTSSLRIIQIFSAFCFVLMIFFSLRLTIESVVASGIAAFLTLLYALPIFSGKRNLRNTSGLKVFVIALVWAISTSLLPFLDKGELLGWSLLVDFIQRLILVIVLTLPFEIRDVPYDDLELETIPQRLGIPQTKIFGTILLLVLFFSEFAQIDDYGLGFLIYSFVLLITGTMLWFSESPQRKYYASFWVEAIPIFYVLLLGAAMMG